MGPVAQSHSWWAGMPVVTKMLSVTSRSSSINYLSVTNEQLHNLHILHILLLLESIRSPCPSPSRGRSTHPAWLFDPWGSASKNQEEQRKNHGGWTCRSCVWFSRPLERGPFVVRSVRSGSWRWRFRRSKLPSSWPEEGCSKTKRVTRKKEFRGI